MVNSKFKGTGVAVITPFDSNYKIDFNSLEKILKNLFKSKIKYLVLFGTTGESATLNVQEKKEIIDFVKRNNINKIPIVIGLGSNDTQNLIENLKIFDPSKIDGILSLTPYYNKPSQNGLLKHFITLADSSKIPIILYNVPHRTGINLDSDTVIELSKHKNIVGIKESSGKFDQCFEIISNTKNFLLISGDDFLSLPMLSIGSHGTISVLANAFPNEIYSISKYFINKSYEQSLKIYKKLFEINKMIFSEGNPAGIKYLLYKMDFCKNYLRLPLTPISYKLEKKIDNFIKKYEN